MQTDMGISDRKSLRGSSVKQEANYGKKRKKSILYHFFATFLVLLITLLVLILVVRNSKWYRDTFDYDAVSFGKFLKKEKLDEGVTRIQSAYLVEQGGHGRKVKVELPAEFWTMITEDYTKFSLTNALRYRGSSLTMPRDDFLFSSRLVMEFELVLSEFTEPVLVKLYDAGTSDGHIWIGLKPDEKFTIRASYVDKYYKEGLNFIVE